MDVVVVLGANPVGCGRIWSKNWADKRRRRRGAGAACLQMMCIYGGDDVSCNLKIDTPMSMNATKVHILYIYNERSASRYRCVRLSVSNTLHLTSLLPSWNCNPSCVMYIYL